jgi:hypothetical protein
MAAPKSIDPQVQLLAQGLHEALLPAVVEADKSMHGVSISQQVLNNQIEKLMAELDKFTDPVAVLALSAYTDKLRQTRANVASINNTLDGVHARLERVPLLFSNMVSDKVLSSLHCAGMPSCQIRDLVRRNVDTRAIPALPAPNTGIFLSFVFHLISTRSRAFSFTHLTYTCLL